MSESAKAPAVTTLPGFDVTFCPDHLEPLRAQWPKGAAQAQLGILNAFLADDRAFMACGGAVERIPDAMREIKPVCCWLAEGEAENVIACAKVGKVYREAK